MGAFIRADLCCDLASEEVIVGKIYLFASNGSPAGWRIGSTGSAFGRDTEARDRFTNGCLRVELSLQIFQVERKVQYVLLFRRPDSHGV